MYAALIVQTTRSTIKCVLLIDLEGGFEIASCVGSIKGLAEAIRLNSLCLGVNPLDL